MNQKTTYKHYKKTKAFLILCIIIDLLFNVGTVLNAEKKIENKVLKIYSYVDNKEDSIYEAVSLGSSVLYGDTILTNAHVILNPDGIPYGNYEVCETYDFKKEPKCNNVGILEYYDADKDLALLSLYNKGTLIKHKKDILKLSTKNLKIGDKVGVYGYPGNGGNTITYTEGKISGFDLGLYKIDANLDYGNSGGGAFDNNGNLIGIPTIINTGATTLGYMIGAKDIEKFLKKQGEIVTLNNLKQEDINNEKKFNKYVLNLQKIINTDNLKHSSFDLNNINKYGFNIIGGAYSYNKKYISRFDLKSKTGKTYIIISSTYNIGQDINLGNFTQKLYKSINTNNKKNFNKTFSKDIKINNKNITINLYLGLKHNSNRKSDSKFIALELVNDNIAYKIIGDLNHTSEIKKAINLFKNDFIIKETYKNNESGIIRYSENFTLDLNNTDVLYTNGIGEYYYTEHYITVSLNSGELTTGELIINNLNNADLTSNTLEGFLKYHTDNKSEYKIIKNKKSVYIGVIKTIEDGYIQYYLYVFNKKDNITLYSFNFRFNSEAYLNNINEYDKLIETIINSISLKNQKIPFINGVR